MTSPLTPEILIYDLQTAGDPQLSPDGERVLYTHGQLGRGKQKGTSQLWLCDRDGGNARQLSGVGERNGGGRWSPDGEQVAFVSDRSGGKDKDQGAALYILPLGLGGEAREVTRHARGLSDLAWSPDGRYIAYAALYDPANPDDTPPADGAPPPVRVTRRIDYKQDNRGYLHDLRYQLFVADVASGARRRLTGDEPNPADYTFPAWSPDGKTIAAGRPNNNGMGSQLPLLDVATGAQTRVGPEGGVVGIWAWSPKGERIIFSGDTKQTYQTDFFVHTVATGETKRVERQLASPPAIIRTAG